MSAGNKTWSAAWCRGGSTSTAFPGYPPTGRRVTFEVFDLVRVKDGQVTEHWAVLDMDGLKRQLSQGPAGS